MAWIAAAAVVGGALISGISGDKASKRAADAQTQAAEASIAEQRRQYDLTRGDQLGQYEQARTDQAPFRESGVAGNQRLAYLLGLTPGTTPGTTATPASASTPMSSSSGGGDQIYVPTTFQEGQSGDPVWEEVLHNFNQSHTRDYGIPMNRPWSSDAPAQHSYNLMVQDYLSRKKAEQAAAAPEPAPAAPAAAAPDPSKDPAYGSLLRKFAASDLDADPVYQSGLKFGLDQGTGAINSRAIAGGGYDSGATIKALTRFANDYGSTKANESYNRYSQDQSNIYNKLAGISGTGQTATNQVGAAGQNMVNQLDAAGQNTANQVTGALGAAGNARSAGIVGGANAWTGALNQGFNNYNNYQMSQALAKLRSGGGASSSAYGGDPYNYQMGRNEPSFSGQTYTGPGSYNAYDPMNYMMGSN